MTTEEKAKAYDEALATAKRVISNNCTEVEKLCLACVSPQLRESEDERIRKSLKDFLRDIANGTNRSMPCAEQCQTWLAYLEEKKKQKPVHTAREMWKDMRLEVYQQASGNRHESNYSDDTTKMFSLTDIDEIFEKIGDSAVEQKPAEWSEEDEKMLASFLHKVEVCDLLSNKENVWIVKRLKSLHPQLIQKEAYKDGFQAARHAIALAFMEYCDKIRPNGKMCLSNGECEEIEKAFLIGDWEKIERYLRKYHWKPSEEQMRAIGGVVHHALGTHWIVTDRVKLGARLKQFPEGAEIEIIIKASKED